MVDLDIHEHGSLDLRGSWGISPISLNGSTALGQIQLCAEISIANPGKQQQENGEFQNQSLT